MSASKMMQTAGAWMDEIPPKGLGVVVRGAYHWSEVSGSEKTLKALSEDWRVVVGVDGGTVGTLSTVDDANFPTSVKVFGYLFDIDGEKQNIEKREIDTYFLPKKLEVIKKKAITWKPEMDNATHPESTDQWVCILTFDDKILGRFYNTPGQENSTMISTFHVGLPTGAQGDPFLSDSSQTDSSQKGKQERTPVSKAKRTSKRAASTPKTRSTFPKRSLAMDDSDDEMEPIEEEAGGAIQSPPKKRQRPNEGGRKGARGGRVGKVSKTAASRGLSMENKDESGQEKETNEEKNKKKELEKDGEEKAKEVKEAFCSKPLEDYSKAELDDIVQKALLAKMAIDDGGRFNQVRLEAKEKQVELEKTKENEVGKKGKKPKKTEKQENRRLPKVPKVPKVPEVRVVPEVPEVQQRPNMDDLEQLAENQRVEDVPVLIRRDKKCLYMQRKIKARKAARRKNRMNHS